MRRRVDTTAGYSHLVIYPTEGGTADAGLAKIAAHRRGLGTQGGGAGHLVAGTSGLIRPGGLR